MPDPEDFAADAEHFSRILALIQDLEDDEAAEIGKAIRKAQRRATLIEVAQVLETGEKALSPAEVWESLRRLLRPDRAGEEIGGAVAGSISRAVEVTGPVLAASTAARTGVDLDFDDIAAGARRWAAGQGAVVIEQMSVASPGLLRAQLDLVLSEAMDITDAARLIRGSLGLSERQASALFNANQDWLRDQAAGRLTVSRRRQLLAEYRERLIDSRATRLARDWIGTATNEGQRRAWAETVELAPEVGSAWERRSVGILSDGRICAYCFERHGWRAPIGGAYEDGSVGPPWPHTEDGASYGCRCREELVEVGSEEGGKPPFVVPSGGGSLRPLA